MVFSFWTSGKWHSTSRKVQNLVSLVQYRILVHWDRCLSYHTHATILVVNGPYSLVHSFALLVASFKQPLRALKCSSVLASCVSNCSLNASQLIDSLYFSRSRSRFLHECSTHALDRDSLSVSILHPWPYIAIWPSPSTQRAPLTSVYNTLWSFGAFVASWVTFGSFKIPSSWAWRIPSAIQGIPSLVQVFLIPFAPESPRWLVSRGRDKEALRILAHYHADGNENDPLIQFEFAEIKNSIKAEHDQKRTEWLQLIRTRGNRRRMFVIIAIAVFSQWSGNGLVSYYLNQVFLTIGSESSRFFNG